MNGSVTPVSGRTLRLPAAMMNAWIPMTSASPMASSARKSSAAAAPIRRPRSTTTRNRPEDGQDADEPELLAERREREVRVDLRDRQASADLGQAGPRPTPEEAAAGERVERLDDLVAGAQRVGEGIQPDVDPVADVVEQAGHEQAAERRTGSAR